MSVYNHLKELVDNGYLLHGSKEYFEVAKPNQRKGLSEKAGRKKAIYTTDIVDLAMFKAIINPKGVGDKNTISSQYLELMVI